MAQPLISMPITALIYSERRTVDLVLQTIVNYLAGQGRVLAGFIQRDAQQQDGTRCDMVLEEILSNERIAISEKRGPLARGCMLDMSELLRAVVVATRALEQKPDLMLINKYGKTEAEGGGFRSLITDSIERSVPVLIAVPTRNLESWRLFSDGLSIDHHTENLRGDIADICRQLGFVAHHQGSCSLKTVEPQSV